MENKIKLENVVMYDRNGYNYVNLFRTDLTKDTTSQKELEKETIKGFSDIREIEQRLDTEMMEIKEIKVNGDVISVVYSYEKIKFIKVEYPNTPDKLNQLNSIKEKQENAEKRKKLDVKKVEKGKETRKRIAVLFSAALIGLASYATVKIALDNNIDIENIKPKTTTEEPASKPEPTPTLRPVPKDLFYTSPPVTELPFDRYIVVETPKPTEVPTPVPTIKPTEVPTPVPTIKPTEIPTPIPTIKPTEVPTVAPTPRPMVEDPYIIMNASAEKLAKALKEAPQKSNQDAVNNNFKIIFNNQETEAASKLLNSDFSFLDNQAEAHNLIISSLNILDLLQMYHVLDENQDAALSNFIIDPVNKSNMKRTEDLVFNILHGKASEDNIYHEITNLDYSNPVISLYMARLLKRPLKSGQISANGQTVFIDEIEADLLVEIFDACLGKPKTH